MKTHLKYVALVVIVLHTWCGALSGQSHRIDSLRGAVERTGRDTLRVAALNRLCSELIEDNLLSQADSLIGAALRLSDELSYERGKARALVNYGIYYSLMGRYGEAVDSYTKAYELSDKLGDRKTMIKCMGNLGNLYRNQGIYAKAIDYFMKTLRMAEELKEQRIAMISLGNIGIIYRTQKDYKKAGEFYGKALDLATKLGDKPGITRNLLNMGYLFTLQNENAKALANFVEAKKIYEELEDQAGVAACYGRIGAIYEIRADSARLKNNAAAAQENTTVALEHFYKARAILEKTQDIRELSTVMDDIADIYTAQKKFGEAEALYKQAMSLSEQTRNNEMLEVLNGKLSRLYERQGNWAKALEHFKMQTALRDSLVNEENTRSMVRSEMNYEFEKKEAAEKLEQEKKEAVAAAESKKQRIIIYSVCSILLLVAGFAVFAYRSYRQKQKANVEITRQKSIIEEKQKEIIDSLHYARRIQTALISSEHYIERTITRLKQ